MSTRFSISLLLSMMISAVLFGIGATTVLSTASLSEHAPVLLPIVIVVSLVFAPIFSWVIAPKLRAKYSREVEAKRLVAEQPGHLARTDRSLLRVWAGWLQHDSSTGSGTRC